MIIEKISKGMADAAQAIQKNFETTSTELAKKQDSIVKIGPVKIAFTAGVSSSECYVTRIGDEVFFEGWIVSPAATYDIYTLPVEFRPRIDSPIVIFKDDTGTGRANMHFNADGKMRINLNTNEGARINLGGISYVAKPII